MIRRLFRVAVAGLCLLSLLACVGAGWLWWRSYRATDAAHPPDALYLTRSEPLYWVVSGPGRLTLCGQRGKDWDSPAPGSPIPRRGGRVVPRRPQLPVEPPRPLLDAGRRA